MDWIQTLTIIGTLGGLMIGLHLITSRQFHREIDALRQEMRNHISELRKDVRLILDKIVPPYK